MVKYILVYLIVSIQISVSAQTLKNGYIIDKKITDLGLAASYSTRYTPSLSETQKADAIVLDNKLVIQKAPGYRNAKQIGIFSKYNGYYKQYIGYINDEGEKIILINFVPKKFIKKDNYNLTEPIVVLDGGNNFWQVEVNLNTKRLLSVHINGGV